MRSFLEEIEKLPEELQGPLLKAFVLFREEVANLVTREDFLQLQKETREFREETEKNIKEVWASIKELAKAQKRTEARVEELAEAQKRTEARVEELAVAQKETQKEVSRLDRALNELAEAQKRTEKEIEKLTKGLSETRRMVGGLSDTVGYALEDRAIVYLPGVLKKRFGITVTKPLVRKYVQYNGTEDELNIFGKGKKGKKEVYIIGEAKARLAKKHIDSFLKLVERLKKHGIVSENLFLLMASHTIRPEVEEYAKNKGIVPFWSYEFGGPQEVI
ncbi:MAG: hypothetical protein D6778_10155 [Nitrospirae bacterium]|nr:MAG: hypothetical protein D6778_10155 [Nitrospirota bacterium]